MSEIIKNVPEFRSYFAAGAFAITYLASRGENHSNLHRDIANIALIAEAATFVSGFGRNEFSKKVGLVGLAVTIGCFAVVCATDKPIVRYLNSDGLMKKENLLNLGKDLLDASKRHLLMQNE